ncbi:hypothetical protein [Bacillus infantis]|uniref:hypothetical protein n=1 Tax=Bacillus infantis TaxID=324767 RepID=UPI00321B0F0E
MIFIQTDKNNVITYQNAQPFSPEPFIGLGKSKEDLEKEGFLVEEVPVFDNVAGKDQYVMYTPEKGFWVEYKDRALTEDDLLQQEIGAILFESAMDKARIAELEASQGDMLIEIAMLKMGGNL